MKTMTHELVESRMIDGGDPGLKFYITDLTEIHCFLLETPQIKMRLHARSAFDLFLRLGDALQKWQDENQVDMSIFEIKDKV